MQDITPEELKAKLDSGSPPHLVDVRQASELAICKLPGAQHVPMLELFTGARVEARPEDEVVVVCHYGLRSQEAAAYLRAQGYTRARSLAGGIDAWATRVDPSLPRY